MPGRSCLSLRHADAAAVMQSTIITLPGQPVAFKISAGLCPHRLLLEETHLPHAGPPLRVDCRGWRCCCVSRLFCCVGRARWQVRCPHWRSSCPRSTWRRNSPGESSSSTRPRPCRIDHPFSSFFAWGCHCRWNLCHRRCHHHLNRHLTHSRFHPRLCTWAAVCQRFASQNLIPAALAASQAWYSICIWQRLLFTRISAKKCTLPGTPRLNTGSNVSGTRLLVRKRQSLSDTRNLPSLQTLTLRRWGSRFARSWRQLWLASYFQSLLIASFVWKRSHIGSLPLSTRRLAYWWRNLGCQRPPRAVCSTIAWKGMCYCCTKSYLLFGPWPLQQWQRAQRRWKEAMRLAIMSYIW